MQHWWTERLNGRHWGWTRDCCKQYGDSNGPTPASSNHKPFLWHLKVYINANSVISIDRRQAEDWNYPIVLRSLPFTLFQFFLLAFCSSALIMLLPCTKFLVLNLTDPIKTGKDVLAKARTGSGKTASYALPIIQRILTDKEVRFNDSVLLSQLGSKKLMNRHAWL